MINLAKHRRLCLTRDELGETRRMLSERRRDLSDGLVRFKADVIRNYESSGFTLPDWSPSDGFEKLLSYPLADLRTVSIGMASVREIVALETEKADLAARLKALDEQAEPLNHLVQACTKYVEAHAHE